MLRLCCFSLLFFGTLTPANAESVRPLVMMYTEWRPFIYEGQRDRPTGFNIDIVRVLIEQKFGRTLVFRSAPWKRVQQDVLRGHADMFSGIPTPQRRARYEIGGQALFAVKAPIYTYDDHPRLDAIRGITSIGDILDLNLNALAVLGNGWHETYVEGAGVPTMHVVRAQSVYPALAAGRADIVVDLQIDDPAFPSVLPLPHDIVDTGVVVGRLSANLIFSRHSGHQVDLAALDDALSDLHATGETARIFKKHQLGLAAYSAMDLKKAD